MALNFNIRDSAFKYELRFIDSLRQSLHDAGTQGFDSEGAKLPVVVCKGEDDACVHGHCPGPPQLVLMV